MNTIFRALALATVVVAGASAGAQQWDSEKFPDYRPGNFNPDPQSVEFGKQFTEAERTGLCPEMRMKRDAARRAKRKAEGEQSVRPDHVNNGATKYFAPVFNQDGGSCGSASRIGYMFTHEMNAFRDLDGSNPENYYPTHFVWLLTNGNSGKDEFVEYVGVPSAKTYGGQTYSRLFGFQEETNDDFGWMTGYDKWYSGFRNRMLKPTSNAYSLATEVGREWAKQWLWNHCGDTDFKAGGLIGLGVASGGQWHDIPKTEANIKAGVAGMKYVHEWGVSVDHALTMVGYDDRVEFDLDGNGIAGEVEKDEVGAWIIVNSWGAWCNGGFIYCPYAFAGASFNNDGAAGKRSFNKNSWWYGELYRVRKNYEPTRTLKIKMDYSRRSELSLSVGVSADLNAKTPEKTMPMHHFIFAGDGNGGNGIKKQTGTNADGKPTYENTFIAPEIPMLGRWADGKLHEEPMEFGYDITDLCAGYDKSQPLKIFFMIDSRTKNGSTYAKGSGHIYELSVMDYSENPEGVETPFDLGETGIADVPCKRQLKWSTIVYGDQIFSPQNLQLTETQLSWQAPQRSGHKLQGYKVLHDGQLMGTTTATSYALAGAGTYSVVALYENNLESSQVSITTPETRQADNVAIELHGNGFTIPEVFADNYPTALIEFWIRPSSVKDYNNAFGDWGKFMFHCNNGGSISAGWDANHRVNGVGKLEVGKWSHVALSVNKTSLTAYINGTSVGTATAASGVSGIGGFGNLTFKNDEKNGQDCAYDEIRIWSVNHKAADIKSEMGVEFSGSVMPDGLLAYYKGDVITINGEAYLRDCVGGHHAKITANDPSTYKQVASGVTLTDGMETGTFSSITVKVGKPVGTIYAGVPATFTATYPDATARLNWLCESSDLKDYSSNSVSITFPKAGTDSVFLTAANADGTKSYTARALVEVAELPELDATFTTTSNDVAAGQSVSFIPVNPQTSYEYHWSMPGATVTESGRISTSATYEKKGIYTVTLTVTSPDGKSASTKQEIEVKEVAPEAAFVVSKPVAYVGEEILLENTSKYNPTSCSWVLSGTGGNIVINGGTNVFTPANPGVFNITLNVSNEAGSATTTQERALTIVNADSKNGLSFSQQSAKVELSAKPLAAGQEAYTIEWWMSPTKLSTYCLGIGESDATFQLRVKDDGTMTLSNKGKVAASNEGFVVANQWHHYAAVVNGTVVRFYRDGVAFGTASTEKGIGDVSKFSIGTNAADMNGKIDEFRIWNKALALTELQERANAPIDDAKSVDGLVLYYDFNQSGGNVEDRSVSANTGVRSGFGPDGDAWGLSQGVFSLNFAAAAPVKDVTGTYLRNYKRSFQRGTTMVNRTTESRFYEIKNWTLENQTVQGGITTGVHVDLQKSSDFTCTTGWDSFSSLSEHKAFQVAELEPGIYTLSVEFGQHKAAGQTYLVAAAGETLPTSGNLGTALGSADLSTGTMTFIVPEKQKVALGVLVASMSGNSIFTIQRFKLEYAPIDVRDAVVPEGIESIALGGAQTTTGGIYDLQGRLQGYSSLRPGVYVINGKKTLVK